MSNNKSRSRNQVPVVMIKEEIELDPPREVEEEDLLLQIWKIESSCDEQQPRPTTPPAPPLCRIKVEKVVGSDNPVKKEISLSALHYMSAWDTDHINCVTCPICLKRFAHTKSVKIHLYSHLQVEEKAIIESGWEFVCYFCDKRFRAPSILDTHMIIHTTEKANRCEKCGKTYTRLSSLNIHRNSHSKKLSVRRKWKCKICGDLFIVNSHLKIHLKYHKGIREHGCKFCGRMFTHRSNLVVHVNSMHKGIRYKCKWCGVSLTQKSGLKQHQERSKRCLAKRARSRRGGK